VRRVASGTMAEVYEARRPGPRGFAKRVAVKRILPQLARDQRLVRMFCAEARLHAALAHPNLVSVLDFGEADGELYLVMEYVDGVPLSDVLRAVSARKRSIEVGTALYIAREVAAGLAYAHQHCDDDAPLGVVHRDVAPNNILLGRAGEVKLTDFGSQRSTASEPHRAPGDLLRKFGYLSPEQAQGRDVEARSDLFSLGVVLAEMLLGAPLIAGRSELELRSALESRGWEELSGLADKAPPPLVALLRRLLAKSPRNRPARAELVVRELDRLADTLGVRSSAHGLSLWLADLGVVRIESNVRVTPHRDDAPARPSAPLPSARDTQATIVDDDALKPIVVALPAPELPAPRPAESRVATPSAPTLRYRLRRPGGQVVGPLSLASVLSMLATARAGLDSELARDDGPFVKLSRAFELTRLASRPLYRFFEPIALLASERHPADRFSLPSHLLRLATQRRTGLLVYRNGAEQRRVYFESGVPTATASTEPNELLGAQLVRSGLVGEADLERVLESGYRSGCSLGESLVRAGLLSGEGLERSLAEQRVVRLAALCGARVGDLFFVDGATCGERAPGPSDAPLAPLLQALRIAYSEQELLSVLNGLAHTALSPSPQCGELRSLLRLAGDEAYAFAWCLRGVKLGLILREARARGPDALCAAAFAIFVGLSAGAFVARPE
jgi:eukaryotic-like serine/threonine-protein kinase